MQAHGKFFFKLLMELWKVLCYDTVILIIYAFRFSVIIKYVMYTLISNSLSNSQQDIHFYFFDHNSISYKLNKNLLYFYNFLSLSIRIWEYLHCRIIVIVDFKK